MFRLASLLMLQGSVLISFSDSITASSEWIADERVRRLDSAPVLGRGYSMRTNSYLSTCLVVNSTSVPSFNYKFERFFLDPSDSVDALTLQVESVSPDSIARELLESALVAVKVQKTERESQQSQGVEKYFKVAAMHVDRYYSSVMESTAMLSPDAQTLLQNEDYEGFFKTCGTYFIRSIRRTQELTVKFEFESSSDQTARTFSSAIDTFTSGRSFDAAFAGLTESSEMASLVTVVEATGLGQTIEDDHDESLVLSDISQLNDVLKFGYKSMTSEQQQGSGQAGKVHSIEVVQWSNNPTFQTLAKVHSHEIYQAVPFEEIPDVKANGTCRRLDHTKDMFDKCCATTDIIAANSTHYYCRPQRLLPPVKMKYNMEQNGEFVATLAGIDRNNNAKMNQLQDCVQNLNNNFRPSEDYKYLKSRALRSEESLSTSFPGVTVKELKMILDPSNDLSLVRLLGFEIEEYRSKFYEPCIDSLYFDDEENATGQSNRAAKFFMAHPYSHHEECTFFNCAFEGMRWNRDSRNGGCVSGLLTHGPTYEDSSNAPQCAKMVDQNTMKVKCVRDQEMLLEIQALAKKCWEQLPIMNISTGSVSNNNFDVSLMSFVERYCGSLELDPLLGEADYQTQIEIDEMAQHCDGYHMACADGTPCHVGRYCDRQTGFCERKKRVGERCEEDNDCFADNAFCDGNENNSNGKLCVEKKEIGAECESSRECKLEDRIVNVASNQETSQSGEEGNTMAPNRLSKRAVDGITDEAALITQAIPESDPWWEVTLSNDYIIRRIKIYHEDTPSDELTLEIFDDDENQVWIYKIQSSRSTTEVDIGSEVIGKRVRLSLQGDQKLLSLKEVEVEGALPRRCDGGKCSCLIDNDECGEGKFCDPHHGANNSLQQCSLPKASGERCSENRHCQSAKGCNIQLGQCHCSTQDDCNLDTDKYCDIYGTNQCEHKKEFDAQCTYNHECDAYPLNSNSECHDNKCRPAASFDYCIKTDNAEKWGWPVAANVHFKETFTEAERVCSPPFFITLQCPSSAGFTVYCNANRWFDPNDIVDDEECMGQTSSSSCPGPYHRDGIWLGGANRGAVYFRGGEHIVNLAMLGTASQSSTYQDNSRYHANKAIDGNIGAGSTQYTHTDSGKHNPWWKVTLDNVYRIDRVIIYNREGYLYRLDGFVLKIRKRGIDVETYGPTNAGKVKIATFFGVEGDEVEIYRRGNNKYLNIQEVVVLGPWR